MHRLCGLASLCTVLAVACGGNRAEVKNPATAYQLVETADAHWQAAAAAAEMAKALDRHADIAAVYAHNDAMAVAAAQTCQQQGHAGIKVLGIGGLAAQVANGNLDATLTCDFAGPAIDLALLACSGIAVSQQVDVGPRLLTEPNVANGGSAHVAPGDFYLAMLKSQNGSTLTTTPTIDIVFRFGFADTRAGEPWRGQLRDELQAAAKRYPQIQLDCRTADHDEEAQRGVVQHFIEQNYNAILVAPSSAQALAAVCQEAMAKGIKVVAIGGDLSGLVDVGPSEPSEPAAKLPYTCLVGADQQALGTAIAQRIKTLLPKGGAIVELRGSATSRTAQLRHQGFAQALGLPK